MKISFDAVPIINGKMTGVGWCEVGQTTAMARLHPEDNAAGRLAEVCGMVCRLLSVAHIASFFVRLLTASIGVRILCIFAAEI